MKKLIASYLPEWIINYKMKYWTEYHFCQNINSDPKTDSQKRVLLSYITYPLENDTSAFSTHTNFSECLEIIKIFIDSGWSVDVAHCLDIKHNPVIEKKKYDMIFGFGEPFYCAAQKNPDAIKVVYLTELHPDFSQKSEAERSEYFYERHTTRAPRKRTGKYLRKQDIDIADFKILLGNAFTSKTYPGTPGKLFTLAPTGLINKDFIFKDRDTRITRQNFVWFGSYGAIHKGLDILIDVFTELEDYHLYVCGLDPSEKRFFRMNGKNVHDIGFVDVTSKSFIDLMNSCSYCILPSCSEAMATSVLTCMNHGLIPIVTRECGIDLPEWGVSLEDYRVDYLKEMIMNCASRDPQLLEKYHREVFEYSRNQFVISRYSRDMTRIIGEIITKKLGEL